MAQALFKSWFIDFDPVIDNALAQGNAIPDVFAKRAEQRRKSPSPPAPLPEVEGSKNNTPLPSGEGLGVREQFPSEFEYTEEMGWIPKGWEVSSIKDEAVIISKGTTPSKKIMESADDDLSILFLKVRDLDNNGKINIDGLGLIPESVHENALKRSKLKANDLLFSIAGTIGRVAIVTDELDNSNCNQALAFIRPIDETKISFLLQLLKSDHIQTEVKSRIVQAVQANVSLTELGSLKFAKASDKLFQSWHVNTQATFEKMQLLEKETVTLTKLRDTLLPKLLSGELRIPDAEKLVSQV